MGGRFEQLGAIIRHFEGEPRLGVCVDTCHIFGAGYELRDADGLERTLETLDGEVGLDRVRAVHANDSKGMLGSHLDRHEQIGEGNLGLDTFRLLVNHPALNHLPFLVETPDHSVANDLRNIGALRALVRPPDPS